MALNHLDKLWLEAEPELVKAVATALCIRHGTEIFGHEAMTPEVIEARWMAYDCDARDCISIVRAWPKKPPPKPTPPTFGETK